MTNMRIQKNLILVKILDICVNDTIRKDIYANKSYMRVNPFLNPI